MFGSSRRSSRTRSSAIRRRGTSARSGPATSTPFSRRSRTARARRSPSRARPRRLSSRSRCSVHAIATPVVNAPDETGVLTPEALDLVVALEREFAGRREELLLARAERQERIAAGELPDFLESTRSVREGGWRVLPAPADLQDRRVEI